MTADIEANSDLDTIFSEVGEFGLYQIVIYTLICIPNALAATFVVNYMFAANTLEYRCKVPECDESIHNREIIYDQQWLPDAIPLTNVSFDHCFRYAPVQFNGTEHTECSADSFNSTVKIKCDEFVYATDEVNLQTDFNIHCSESYKLALVGTVNNIGRFIFLPLTGMLSDKFGRLSVVIVGMTCSCIFGLIKSFSFSYLMYIIFEFMEASAGTCTYAGMYILGIEWVNSKYRVLGSCLMATTFPIGEMLLGVAAMYIHNYRYLLRILYTPGLLIIFYFWLVPESVRWLLVTGKTDRAVGILHRIASVNGRTLSNKSVEILKLRYSTNVLRRNSSVNDETVKDTPSIGRSLLLIMKSRTLFTRFLIGCYQWITCCYCYYGLSMISTQIPDTNRYTSFIIVAAVEIPGALAGLPLLNYYPRRKLLFSTLVLGGGCMISTAFVPEHKSSIVLLLFMIGKASITCAFTITYAYTAEMWPTCLRTTIMNSCSMIGRIGAMVAPLTPLLASHFASLPYLLFGSTAIVAGFSTFFLCETFSKKLPDTIEEAESL